MQLAPLGGPIPHVEIKPSAELVVVDIVLRDGAPGRNYDVVLEKAATREPIWSAKLPTIVSPSGDARLVFDLPVQRLEPGMYSLVVSSTPPAPSIGSTMSSRPVSRNRWFPPRLRAFFPIECRAWLLRKNENLLRISEHLKLSLYGLTMRHGVTATKWLFRGERVSAQNRTSDRFPLFRLL